MAIKTFCDCCGDEIVQSKNDIPTGKYRLKTRVKAKIGGGFLDVEIITGTDGVANAGHYCRYCVIDAVIKMDDRPRCGEMNLA